MKANNNKDEDSLKDKSLHLPQTRNMTELGEKNFARMTLGNNKNCADEAVQQLREHLETAQPFNRKWMIKEFLSEGAFGSVIAVSEHKPDGSVNEAVLKVSKGEAANKQAEWESLILRKIQTANRDASVVRLLDSGTLSNFDEDYLKFLVVERCDLSIAGYLKEKPKGERKKTVCLISIGVLKGLFDIHRLGIIHRDVKSMNCGLVNDSDGQVKVLLFDFGNARLYTDDAGNVFPPRTTTNYCGSREFSSNWADDMRDQTRWDDLFSWFYMTIDLMNPDESAGDSPLPWTFANSVQHRRASTFLKGPFQPAKITLRHCPMPFYAIHSYLHTSHRQSTPNYGWLVEKMREAMHCVTTKSSSSTS